jgi:16S rRNA (cytosine967-C5)-methyltransferase
VVAGGESLDRALEATVTDDLRDVSLLRAIAFGSIRWHHRLHWQCTQLLDRPLKRGDAALAALLRIGLFQLQWLRVPDHAAVAASVDAAPLLGEGRR